MSGGDVLADSIRQAVRRPEVVEAMCQALEQQLRASLGGADVYVGKRPDRGQRDARVWSGFKGDNYDELARQEGISPRQVRRIVSRKPKGACRREHPR
jgi:Mor family transcriptional regulator